MIGERDWVGVHARTKGTGLAKIRLGERHGGGKNDGVEYV